MAKVKFIEEQYQERMKQLAEGCRKAETIEAAMLWMKVAFNEGIKEGIKWTKKNK